MGHPSTKSSTGTLALAALGVVYGDIGTSPLYAFKEAFIPEHGFAPTEVNVLAALSAFFWAMTLIVSIKYVWIILKFDNNKEGGVLALTALAHRVTRHLPRLSTFVVTAGVFAAALFYGDAMITPAISVLSAVEGISVVAPHMEEFVIPITVGILVGLFLIQHHGTARVGGRLFGPVTVIWFVTLGVLGTISIAQNPDVLRALNPSYAVSFAIEHPVAFFILMSAVFLSLTGGEALYADMGHFGARPVRIAWFGLVWPALLLNYFGQGALILRSSAAAENPFYLLAPDWFIVPLVALATAATVIASQAVISGAYSMTLQATRLGYLPRLRILHTSDTERGQIYIPTMNWLMLFGVTLLVIVFGSSSGLAAAYGIAVSGTMIITTLLAVSVTSMLPGRKHSLLLAGLVFFGLLETMFLASNLTKIASGGWMPLMFGIFIFILLSTWKHGSRMVTEERGKMELPMESFISFPPQEIPRVAGTAVYLTSDPNLVPSALFHNLKHFKVLHEKNVFLHVVNEDVPWVDRARRAKVTEMAPGFYTVALHYGFREEPDVSAALDEVNYPGLTFDPMSTSYFVARSYIVEGPGKLPRWRALLFAWMTRQSEGAASYYKLPPNRVVELGTQMTL